MPVLGGLPGRGAASRSCTPWVTLAAAMTLGWEGQETPFLPVLGSSRFFGGVGGGWGEDTQHTRGSQRGEGRGAAASSNSSLTGGHAATAGTHGAFVCPGAECWGGSRSRHPGGTPQWGVGEVAG